MINTAMYKYILQPLEKKMHKYDNNNISQK